MLIFGGFLGYAVCFVLVATPLAAVLAAQLGFALVFPIVGIAISPVFTPPLVVIVVVHIVLVLILYLIASAAVRTNIVAPATDLAAGPLPAATAGAPPAPWQNRERFARGALIGQNACFTMLLTWTLLPWLFQWVPVVGPALLLSSNLLAIAGIVIGLANLMALDESVCADRNYAAFMGWTSWVAAGSTLVNLLGTLFWLVSVVASWLGVRLISVTPETWTGTWVVHGGPMFLSSLPASWVTGLGLSPDPTAYNLGTFLFVDGRLGATTPALYRPTTGAPQLEGATAVGLTFHETGHTLNLAAFGSWFHAIGAIDENVVQRLIGSSGLSTYSEILPEGHARDSSRPWFPLWAPPVGPVGTTSNVPPIAGMATVNGIPPNVLPAPPILPVFIVVPAGSMLTLASAGAVDPDTFPQGLVGPGATPPLGTLWALPVVPAGSAAVVAGPLLANTTAAIDVGGDYSVAFGVTDGIQLAGGADWIPLGAAAAGAAQFVVSAVQAIISGPTQVGIGSSITLSAASSTAGTAGVAVAPMGGGGPPLLVFAWTANPGAALTLTPGLTPELVVVQRTGAGTATVTLTATEQLTGAGVSHSTTISIS